MAHRTKDTRNEHHPAILALALAYIARHHDEIDDLDGLMETLEIDRAEAQAAWSGYISQIDNPFMVDGARGLIERSGKRHPLGHLQLSTD